MSVAARAGHLQLTGSHDVLGVVFVQRIYEDFGVFEFVTRIGKNMT